MTLTSVRARFLYRVEQLYLDKGSLGSIASVATEGVTVEIAMPTGRPGAPRTWVEDFANPWGHGTGVFSTDLLPHALVTQIATSVLTDIDVSAAEASSEMAALEVARERLGAFVEDVPLVVELRRRSLVGTTQ